MIPDDLGNWRINLYSKCLLHIRLVFKKFFRQFYLRIVSVRLFWGIYRFRFSIVFSVLLLRFVCWIKIFVRYFQIWFDRVYIVTIYILASLKPTTHHARICDPEFATYSNSWTVVDTLVPRRFVNNSPSIALEIGKTKRSHAFYII